MDSRERLIVTLNHKEPDRVPLDLGGSVVTGIHKVAYARLLDYLGFPGKKIETFDIIQQLAGLDDFLKEKFGVDVEGVFPQVTLVDQEIEEENYHSFYDQYGIKWSKPQPGGLYHDMREHPLSDAEDPDDIENFTWPDPADPALVDGLRERIMSIKERTGRAIALGVAIGGLGAGIFEMGFWLRGYKNFYLDLGRKGKLLNKLLDKLTELRITYWDNILDEVGDLVDVAIEADDLGMQDTTMISQRDYDEILLPRHKKIFGFVKEKTSNPIKVFLHSCGAISNLIPSLIDAGVDILNPVQVSASGMNSLDLKKRFGDELTFWGGGVDTQSVLPNGTEEEVRAEVRRRINDLAGGGGFVFAPVHNIQADVPPENIVAMIEAFTEYGKY